MSLNEIYRSVRALEAIENFAYAGYPKEAQFFPTTNNHLTHYIYQGEEEFWGKVLNGGIPFGSRVELYEFAVTEWVGRIPGLFWTDNAAKFRKTASEAGVYRLNNTRTFQPLGKSRKVMGGVGTLKFPSNFEGYKLVGLTASLNASAGIPLLIKSDVWDYFRLAEGTVIHHLSARWQSMTGTTWAQHFQSTRDIPKGFLVLESNSSFNASQTQTVSTRFHPFSVMEYSNGNTTLYDFVYATADTGNPNHRNYISDFFECYRRDNNRFGRYLLAADIENPLWDAEYDSPEALQRAEHNSKTHLGFLQERVKTASFGGRQLDEILGYIVRTYNTDEMQLLAYDIDVPPSIWFRGGTSSAVATDLLNTCLSRGKVESLVEKIALSSLSDFV